MVFVASALLINVMLIRELSRPFDIISVLVILATENHEVLGHLEG